MTPANLAKFEPHRRHATLVPLAVEGMATVTDESIDLLDITRASRTASFANYSPLQRTSPAAVPVLRQRDQRRGQTGRGCRTDAGRSQEHWYRPMGDLGLVRQLHLQVNKINRGPLDQQAMSANCRLRRRGIRTKYLVLPGTRSVAARWCLVAPEGVTNHRRLRMTSTHQISGRAAEDDVFLARLCKSVGTRQRVV
jgi:hypothetical protein